MTQQPNPFSTGADLKGVIAAASEIISGEPVLPDQFKSHVDAAADEIGKLEGPTTNDDINKIMKKHFDNASEGTPQSTKTQTAFQKEIGKKVHQDTAKKKWQEG